MVKKFSFLLILMAQLQGCSQTSGVDYAYPKNRPDLDASNVGSLAGQDGFYLTKPN